MTPRVLPYHYIVGQESLKLALEVAFVARPVGGVLATGERGSAKSTTVRAFAMMALGRLPVTLPINATDDRVLGGWRIDSLMRADPEPMPGLLEQAGADGKGLLYIDEVNLLDDHLVNLILDVASTGVLTLQRDGFDEQKDIRFSLVGTMNPDEGGLRPQLLDRFGLVVPIRSEARLEARREIIRRVLRFEASAEDSEWLTTGRESDAKTLQRLTEARDRLPDVEVPDQIIDLCAELVARLDVVGHRGELVTVWAARAVAALDGRAVVSPRDVAKVAELALGHRRSKAAQQVDAPWTDEDTTAVESIVAGYRTP